VWRASSKAASLFNVSTAAEADAKSILSILTLAASRGTDLKIIANGVDEKEALDAVVGLFSRDFDETRKNDWRTGFTPATKELRCKGFGVSDGIVFGRVLRLQEGTRNVYRARDCRGRSRTRATAFSRRSQTFATPTRSNQGSRRKELGRGHAYIFDAHLLFLQDAKLTRDVEDYIVKERSNAEWAAKVVGDRLLVDLHADQ
jgi:phosphotransferase system HPr (HPr) family protein